MLNDWFMCGCVLGQFAMHGSILTLFFRGVPCIKLVLT